MTSVTDASDVRAGGAAGAGAGEAVRFLEAPAGLGETDFRLYHVENGLYALRAANDTVRVFCVHGSLLRDYRPVITDEQAARLGLERPEDAEVYVIVNPASGDAVVNLLAPVVVNVRTREGLQLVIETDDWPVRAPLAPLLAR